jgi:hypothetical protein
MFFQHREPRKPSRLPMFVWQNPKVWANPDFRETHTSHKNHLAVSGHEKTLPQAVQTPGASDASIRSTTARAEPFSASPPPEHPHLTPKMRDKSDARLRYIKAVRSSGAMWGAHKKPQQPSSPCNQTWWKIPCKLRVIAGKLIYKWLDFPASYVWLPEGNNINYWSWYEFFSNVFGRKGGWLP